MAGGGPLPVREYANAAEMRQDVAATRARFFPAIRPIVVIPAKVVPSASSVPRSAHRRPYSEVTTGMVREMRKLRADNKSLGDIAKLFGVTHTTVRRHVKDVPPPEGGWSTGGHYSTLPIEQIQRMRRAGFTYDEIGENFGCAASCIWRRINGKGKPHTGGGNRKPIDRIIQRLSRATGLHQSVIRRARSVDPRRGNPEQSKARHILFWFLVRHAGMSMPDAGRSCGGFDHSSVHHGVHRVDRVLSKLSISTDAYQSKVMRELWAADWAVAK